jgi:ParB family transcriptional regulator, chromosome partitioning protein
MDLNKLLEKRKAYSQETLNNSLPTQNRLNVFGTVIEVDIRDISENENQPRKEYKADKIESLAGSIKEKGLIQPIIVKPSGNGFLIIAGHRRYRAFKLLEYTKIPCIVKDEYIGEKELTEFALVENLQREDLNVVEIAESLFQLKSGKCITQDVLARLTGYSQPNISKYLRLYGVIVENNELREKVKELGLKEAYEQLGKLDSLSHKKQKKGKTSTIKPLSIKLKKETPKEIEKAIQQARAYITYLNTLLKPDN